MVMRGWCPPRPTLLVSVIYPSSEAWVICPSGGPRPEDVVIPAAAEAAERAADWAIEAAVVAAANIEEERHIPSKSRGIVPFLRVRGPNFQNPV